MKIKVKNLKRLKIKFTWLILNIYNYLLITEVASEKKDKVLKNLVLDSTWLSPNYKSTIALKIFKISLHKRHPLLIKVFCSIIKAFSML